MNTSRKARPASRTHERVMTAVRELLDEGTFHESTVEEVAVRAGVSRASLYQNFGSRLGLVDAMCATFGSNPHLLALRATSELDEFLERVVEFWSAEEKILSQLYGAAAVDPAAGALVERQRRDRYGELRRIVRESGVDERRAFSSLATLTSFETFQELHRHVGLPKREVIAQLRRSARALLVEDATSGESRAAAG